MRSALYEFMPYGAPELIDDAPLRLSEATAASIGLWILAFLSALTWMTLHPPVRALERVVVVPYREMTAPPPLGEILPPPQVAMAATPAAPAAGVVVPVPEAEALAEQTFASQQEIASTIGTATIGGGEATVVVVEPPPPEDLPQLGDYVYGDELPVLITDVPPRYPEIAREAQAEGEVVLRVLVGKDGRVKDVHVDASAPMFNSAAIEAARQWVFKPALTGNRPVAVWIVRRLRFRLSG